MDFLIFMKEEFEKLKIPYCFREWDKDVIPATYWVGEYSEVPTLNEDGYCETQFILTGTTRGSWFELERTKELIRQHFYGGCGLRGMTAGGVIAVYYENALPVPTGEAELKRIEIHFLIKEWKGMIECQ